MHHSHFCLAAACLAWGFTADALHAQAPAVGAQAPRPAPVVSPEVSSSGRVVFRIRAPKATTVTLNGGDIPAAALLGPAAPVQAPGAAAAPPAPGSGGPVGPTFTKNEQGVWEATVGPVPPGAFRYVFVVDDVRTIDPVNTRISESNTATWSMFEVPGLAVQEQGKVPHGAVAEVFYPSSVLARTRRMHVYTPPGYETSTRKYPVFYLLHGSGDTDDGWTSVGRAGFIFDNLIANGKVPPLIVVMPAGHQSAGPPTAVPPGGPMPTPPAIDPFTLEFVSDVMPYVDGHYRTLPDRAHRAIAGLSMGGRQTMDIAFRHLDRFSYIGVFSSGAVLGGPRVAAPTPSTTFVPVGPDWEAVHQADLDNAALKTGTKLVWLATGVDDRLMPNTRATVDLLRKHGFSPEFKETAGGHTWLNWRDYLIEFTVLLFR